MYGITIDRASNLSAMQQLCRQLRRAIETGALPAGTRLVPTRILAKEWGIARNVIVEAYEQLTAEGYLYGRVGAGTFVAEGVRISRSQSNEAPAIAPHADASSESSRSTIHFATGNPDFAMFPATEWAKYMKIAAEHATEDLLRYGDVRGDYRLREAICQMLFRMKGIRCTPEQTLIVSGSSEGFLIIAKALADRFHSIYLENPTIEITRNIFQQMHYRLVPVEVDEQGMKIDSLSRLADGHLALLTSSHQFPTGSLLSVQRRKQALESATAADAYLIEDDYDGEFRLKGIPVPPLFTLDPDRVLYVGTFSKTLAPGLRIGFVLVPPPLVETMIAMKECLNLRTPFILQRALYHFIHEGRYLRHVHRMKMIYKKRRNHLKQLLHHYFGPDVRFPGDEVGMHLHVEFPSPPYCHVPWDQANLSGEVEIETIAEYEWAGSEKRRGRGIVLGYGNLDLAALEVGVRKLHAFAIRALK